MSSKNTRDLYEHKKKQILYSRMLHVLYRLFYMANYSRSVKERFHQFQNKKKNRIFVLLHINSKTSKAHNFTENKTPSQVLSCDFYEIFKNSYTKFFL